jgi:methylglyoxal synthase
MKPRIALIAHDKKKDDMIALAGEYRDFLGRCTLTATGTTGGRLIDPMTPQPHEPDINALVRACDVHNIPCATNVSTSRLVLSRLMELS